MYAIEFSWPDGPGVTYAGKTKDGLGFSPFISTALLCETREEAQRWLENGYGTASEFGKVIEVADADA